MLLNWSRSTLQKPRLLPPLCRCPLLHCESVAGRFASHTQVLFGLDREGHKVAFPTQTHDRVCVLPVLFLLAQPVSQGTRTELWCQAGFSCASPRGHDPHSQMQAALHTHMRAHTHVNHIMSHFLWAYKQTSFICSLSNLSACFFCCFFFPVLPLPTLSLSLLSDARAQREGKLTPWTHLWTRPGIILDTQTLTMHTGINSLLLKL